MRKTSEKAVARLCASGAIETEDREVYEYALNILLMGVLHSLTVLFIGLLLGMFLESLVLFSTFFLARKFAGGYHASKHWQCYLFTVVTVTGALLLASLLLTQSSVFFYVLLAVSALAIFLLAPVEHANKPLSAKEKKVYRLISWAICVVLAGLSIAFFQWISPSVGLAVNMGLMLCAFALVLAVVEKQLRAKKADSMVLG
ncbi:MAG: accessory gene regulator B family protein [Oscillospiraceae bacterium]|nr:accessory gene regulator B family protein [Oscillospiraceae bacterium]